MKMALAKLTVRQSQAQGDSLSLTNKYNNSKCLSPVNGSLLGKDPKSEWSLCVSSQACSSPDLGELSRQHLLITFVSS